MTYATFDKLTILFELLGVIIGVIFGGWLHRAIRTKVLIQYLAVGVQFALLCFSHALISELETGWELSPFVSAVALLICPARNIWGIGFKSKVLAVTSVLLNCVLALLIVVYFLISCYPDEVFKGVVI